MFQLAVFFIVVAVAASKPVYPGGIGGIGTVSVTRTTDVVSPGIYSRGMIGGSGVGVMGSAGMLGAGMMRNPMMYAKTINSPLAEATELVEESVVEEVVEPRILSPGVTETVVEENVEVETPYGVSEVITKETGIITRGIAKRSPKAQYPLDRAAVGLGIRAPGISETVVERDSEVETPYGVSEVAESDVAIRGIAKRSPKAQYPLGRAGLGIGAPGLRETVVEKDVEVDTPYGVSEVRESDVITRGIAKRSPKAQYPLDRASLGRGIGALGLRETVVEKNVGVDTPYGVSEVRESDVIARGVAKRSAMPQYPLDRAGLGLGVGASGLGETVVEKNVEVETPYGVSETRETDVATTGIARRSAVPQYPLGRAGLGLGIGSPGLRETVVNKDVEVDTPYGVSEVAETEVIAGGIAKRSPKAQYPLDRASLGRGIGAPGLRETVVEKDVEDDTPYGVSEVRESDVTTRGITKRSPKAQYLLDEALELGIGYPGYSETVIERDVEVDTPYGLSEVTETEVITRGIAKRSAMDQSPRKGTAVAAV